MLPGACKRPGLEPEPPAVSRKHKHPCKQVNQMSNQSIKVHRTLGSNPVLRNLGSNPVLRELGSS